MEPPVAGEQPQPNTQTLPEGGAQPQQQKPLDVQAAISGMTNEKDIGALLFGNAEPAPTTPSTPSGETSPAELTTLSQEPAGAQPLEPAQGDAPQEPQSQPQSLERISLKSLHPDERVLIAQAKEMVREGKAASFADAFQSLIKPEAGTQEPAPQAQAQAQPQSDPQPSPATAAVELDQSVTDITTRLADLRAQRKAAVEEFDRPAEIELTNQIEDTLADLAEAKSQSAIRNRESTTQDQAIEAVIQDIYVDHPEAEDPDSFFSYRMTRELTAYEKAHGSIRNHPQQLKGLASKIAAEITGQSTGQTQQQPAAAAAPILPRQNARPIGAAAPGHSAAVRTSPDQLQGLINTASAEDLRAALFGAQ